MRDYLTVLFLLAGLSTARAQIEAPSSPTSPCVEHAESLACLLSPGAPAEPLSSFPGGVVLKPATGSGIINNNADPQSDENLPRFVPQTDIHLSPRAVVIDRRFQEQLLQGQ